MSEIDWQTIWERAVRNSPYAPTAFEFIRDGLGHTVDLIHGDGAASTPVPGDDAANELMDSSRHVTGQQLCMGLRDYAIKRYGLLARLVLGSWGVRSTVDFGHLVFALVDAGLMRKTDDDSLDDFQGVFDFREEFLLPEEDRLTPAAGFAATNPAS
jgi:uncharacterized repeat protein (TIGR04138 family)